MEKSRHEKPEENVISPFRVILKAFEFLNTEAITLNSLLTIAKQTGSPNDEITKNILNQMCKMGLLTWSSDQNIVVFQRTVYSMNWSEQ